VRAQEAEVHDAVIHERKPSDNLPECQCVSVVSLNRVPRKIDNIDIEASQ